MDVAAATLAPARTVDRPRVGRGGYRWWLVANLVAAGSWLSLLIPYLVNDLGDRPLADWSGGVVDSSTVWPFSDGGATAAAFGFAALLAVFVAPFVAITSALGALTLLMVGDRRAFPTGLVAAILVVAVTTSALVASPLGQALSTWFLD